MTYRALFLACFFTAIAVAQPILAADPTPGSPPLPRVPAGFSIELAAGPPLIERPIVASFDDEGRLYVAESSGSNDPVQKQLELKPHRIVRLEDSDGDGKFDKRIVFADHLMFPEGALFFDGSLYVSAPPSIWKLTDKDGDGVADDRVEWFQGKTLTGCANDLHGPYAGPDGFIYWCKGAFAEQTHMVNGREWKTKAAHIFRCRPDGTDFEPVMTGGMDNPVDVAFMPNGERILSGTFFHVNPRYDGLIHAVYGGVYGKNHGVLAGHPRTGELMPILDPISAAAGSGLERYDCDVFGTDYRDNLFLCQFNLRKVSRHVLRPDGGTYKSEDTDFVSSDFVDFHPTDVQVDADGSLLVIDTGGWYKLCCPTSQLWKPDVLGGIYRVRKTGSTPPRDPRGRSIAWSKQTPAQLWAFLGDSRSAVRQRATREFVHRDGTKDLQQFFGSFANRSAKDVVWSGDLQAASGDRSPLAVVGATARVWALSQINSKQTRRMIAELVPDDLLRHVAAQSASLHRDATAGESLGIQLIAKGVSAADRRIIAEALGRIGDPHFVKHLLATAATVPAGDRFLQHSIAYALIEISDPQATRGGLTGSSPKTVAVAMIALDQMPNGAIKASDVIPHLGAIDETLRQAAGWVVRQHPEWGSELAQWFQEQLKSLPSPPLSSDTSESSDALEAMLVMFAGDSTVQQLLANAVTERDSSAAAREASLRVMANAKLKGPPMSWIDAIAEAITSTGTKQLPLAIAAARRFPIATAGNAQASQALADIAGGKNFPLDLRVGALSIFVCKQPKLSDSQFELVRQSLSSEIPVTIRSTACEAISKSQLSPAQLDKMCAAIEAAGPLELNRLLKPFGQSTDEALGLKLVASIKRSSSLASLRMDLLREALTKYGSIVQHGVDELESLVNVDAGAQRKRIEELLPLVAKGDIRRGHAAFYSTKATCSTCHRLGAAGGTTGPDLTDLGKTRTERDILESILFPNLSFVRSYEPVLITTQDGKVINGVIRDETSKEYVLATGPNQEVRIAHEDVDQMQPSAVSIMPAGLDKQLSAQELADLVAFLKNTAGK